MRCRAICRPSHMTDGPSPRSDNGAVPRQTGRRPRRRERLRVRRLRRWHARHARRAAFGDHGPNCAVAHGAHLAGVTPISDTDLLIDDPVCIVIGEGPVWGEGDPNVNPISRPLDDRLPTTVIYVGTLEVLYPGVLRFQQAALAAGNEEITVVLGNGQIHNWAQGGIPTNFQSPLVRQDIYEQLGLVPLSRSRRNRVSTKGITRFSRRTELVHAEIDTRVVDRPATTALTSISAKYGSTFDALMGYCAVVTNSSSVRECPRGRGRPGEEEGSCPDRRAVPADSVGPGRSLAYSRSAATAGSGSS